MSRNRATMIGFSAVLMWSFLALFTIGSAPVPPFLLNAMCFAIGGGIGLIWTARRGFGVLRGGSMPLDRLLYLAIMRCISPPFGWRLRPKPG